MDRGGPYKHTYDYVLFTSSIGCYLSAVGGD